MKRQSLQDFCVNYGRAFKLSKIFVEQQYSMRSYETGRYDIRSDGNLRSILNTIVEFCMGEFVITITVPEESSLKNGREDIQWLESFGVDVVERKYGDNARHNRELHIFSRDPIDEDTLYVTYFETECRNHCVFVCPGSPRPENPVYSMDEYEWFQDQVFSASATFFFNENQNIFKYEGYVSMNEPVAFEIEKFVKPEVPIFGSTISGHIHKIGSRCVYFPYRITDKDYLFDELLTHDVTIFATDPNQSLRKHPMYDIIKDRIVLISPSRHKECLNAFLSYAGDSRVWFPSDARKTVHLGPVEILSLARYYRSENKLMWPGQFSTLNKTEIIEKLESCII